MQEQQFEGILKCEEHGVAGCVKCAVDSALTRDGEGNRHERRAAEAEARRHP